MKVTINDVAREAGVSIATVSRYLTNPVSIKKENRSRVEQAVKALHYKPYVYARKLAGGKLGVFGLVIPGYEGIFYSFYALEIIRGMGLELKDLNKDLYLHIYWGEDRLNSSLVDGIIFADVLENERQLKRILKEKLPCVVINKKVDDLDVSYVAVDNFKGAYLATEYLIKQGHTKIAHIAGDLRVESAQARLEGYRRALTDYKITVRDSFMKEAHYSRPEARRAIEELFAKGDNPTAVFAGSDDMALEVFHFAQKENIAFPDDLSLIGFDDNPLCMYENLELTTVRQPIREMVSCAVDILRKSVDKGETEIVKKMLEPELVIRKSVGAQ